MKVASWVERPVTSVPNFSSLEFIDENGAIQGFVTFDWRNRLIRTGLSTQGSYCQCPPFKGRGWQDKMRSEGRRILIEAYEADGSHSCGYLVIGRSDENA